MGRDFYVVLGVGPTASEDEIRLAYRTMAKRCHPDVSGGSAQRMVDLNQAYETLGDSARRARYDASERPSRPLPRRPRPMHEAYVDPSAFYGRLFSPQDARIKEAIEGLLAEMDELSGDPYDDQLMEAFEEVVVSSWATLQKAQRALGEAEAPPQWTTAIGLYEQGLRQIEDALLEFETFTLNYHMDHLVDGRSILLGAADLLTEARERLRRR